MNPVRSLPVMVAFSLSLLPASLVAQQPTAPEQPATLARPGDGSTLLPIALPSSQAAQPPSAQPQTPAKPGQPEKTQPPAPPQNPQPDSSAFARANEAVASAPRSLTPGVFGDQFGGNCLKIFNLEMQPGTNKNLDGVCVALPSSLVGRFKVAENNSPIPGDRAYFDYNFFSTTVYGLDVSRFTVGVEKSFFDGCASLELRLPFASTLDGQQVSDFGFQFGVTNNTTTRFGDLQIISKFIIAQHDCWTFGGGLGVSVPTAPDFEVTTERGDGILRVKNEAVHLQPFLSFHYAPDDRFYLQGFSGLDIDLNGYPVQVQLFPGSSDPFSTVTGRLRDRTFWTTDVAAGYWVYRNPCAWLTGLAPQLEVHWNQAIDKVNSVEGNIGGIQGDTHIYSNVNLGAILNLEFRNNSRLAIGAVFPVTDNNNRDFSVEFGVLFNYHF